MSVSTPRAVSFADVEAAADTIRGSVIATPTLPAQTLSEIAGAELWVKFENQQFTGSFKERGARNFLAHLPPEDRAPAWSRRRPGIMRRASPITRDCWVSRRRS